MGSYFCFNGARSSEFGLMIEEVPAIPIPQKRIFRQTVPGRSGAVEIWNGAYESVSISYNVAFVVGYKEDVVAAARIAAWLISAPNQTKLQDTYDPEYFRLATFEGPAEITNVARRAGRSKINFTASPFKYSITGQNTYNMLKNETSINNPEKFPSRPYFKVYGTGSGNIHINNKTIQLKNIDSYVEIDTELMQVFKGGENKNGDVVMPEEWPKLLSGNNMIQFDGDIEKIDYIPRWCTL